VRLRTEMNRDVRLARCLIMGIHSLTNELGILLIACPHFTILRVLSSRARDICDGLTLQKVEGTAEIFRGTSLFQLRKGGRRARLTGLRTTKMGGG